MYNYKGFQTRDITPEDSQSTIKVFVMSRMAKRRVVCIASLSFSKYLVASCVQENASFFNDVVMGVSILPYYLINLR
jgi:hypothetical protein